MTTTNCVGFCDSESKLFQKPRRAYRPPVRSTTYTSAPFLQMPTSGKFALMPRFPPRTLPDHARRDRHNLNVKRMRKRRDNAKNPFTSGEQPNADADADGVIELQDEYVALSIYDKEEEENARRQVARNILGICGILLVILGIGVLIYAIIALILSMTSKTVPDTLNKTFKPLSEIESGTTMKSE